MILLALDIGGLTQDILLFDTSKTIENCVKMVMPSPTIILAQKIQAATKAHQTIFLKGVNMGGGPSKRALRNHLAAGLAVYATPGAATTFDDDLDEVSRWGVIVVDGEQVSLPDEVRHIETGDLDLAAISKALEAFEVKPRFDAMAIAVLDHGAAPPNVSDRLFRFEHLHQAVSKNPTLHALAYPAQDVPAYLTRMRSVGTSLNSSLPLLLMDTPVAAAIGAIEDNEVARHPRRVVVNTGNFHTLAFHLDQDSILGFFEHHTRLIDGKKLDTLIDKLVRGKLTNEEVYDDNGHGCFILDRAKDVPFVTVTGPQRRLMVGSRFNPHFAAPYGDMMLTGCFGLVRAFSQRMQEGREEIEAALAKG